LVVWEATRKSANRSCDSEFLVIVNASACLIALVSYHFVIAAWRAKAAECGTVKYWEIIADNLKQRGWSLGYVSAIGSQGRTIWIADAHRDGKGFIVRANEKLTAFLELESAIRRVECKVSPGVFQ
jgi:hypothetical protein